MSILEAIRDIDPTVFEIGNFKVKWYGVAYVLGLVLGWRYVRILAKEAVPGLSHRIADDFLMWCLIGVVVGGRLGSVVFYNFNGFIERPWIVFLIWEGGMSFHGGTIGVILALAVFSRRRNINILSIADAVACAVPIGLFFGRVANFINQELYGRISDVAWAIQFKVWVDRENGVYFWTPPRHPSQLYEAFLEGLILFCLLAVLAFFFRAGERPGLLTGVFLSGYGVARIVAELFREPDANLGFVVWSISMGQVLSIPMFVVGLYFIFRTIRWRSIEE